MTDIEDVNSALEQANHVDEYAFAEAVLIGASKNDLESIKVTFSQNKEAYEELVPILDALKVYYENLAKILSANQMPSYNEAVAAEKAEAMAEKARVMVEQSELMIRAMDNMINTTGKLHTLANALSNDAKTLIANAKAVIERQ
jgi:phage-related protein